MEGAGGRVLIKLSFPPLQFTPYMVQVPLWRLNNLCTARSDSHSQRSPRWLAILGSYILLVNAMQVVARGSLLYGGGCTTNGDQWTPLPSLLPSYRQNLMQI